jgi:hypothetical protein
VIPLHESDKKTMFRRRGNFWRDFARIVVIGLVDIKRPDQDRRQVTPHAHPIQHEVEHGASREACDSSTQSTPSGFAKLARQPVNPCGSVAQPVSAGSVPLCA